MKTKALDCSDKNCTLAIVPVQVKLSNSNNVVQTYAFLDQGSSATFCTEQLRIKLNATGKRKQILLHTMGQKKPINSLVIKGLEVCSLEGTDFIDLPEVYTQHEIPVGKEYIPRQEDLRKWSYLQDVKIPNIDAEIDLLIGVNAPKLMEPWRIINSQGNGPFAIKTLLGWVVNGLLHNEDACINQQGQKHVHSHRTSVEKLSELLIQQYNHDFPEKGFEEKKQMSVEDCRYMHIMDSSAKIVNGHYQLPLPFKKDDPTMPNNRHLAEQLSRTLSLRRKFQRNIGFHLEYTAFMDAVLSSGHAELVPQEQLIQENGKVWYIPHHGVFHPKKGSLRVWCSAAYQGKSLNTELLQGPNLTNTLIGVLVRFRLGKIAIMADVEKMFHQVKVPSHHVNFLRFLWWPNGDINQPLKEYRMVVHLFGATSSSSCASYALKRTAEDNKGCFSAEATRTVRNNFYVDDLLKAVDTEGFAIKICKELKLLCATAGFNLTKWISNNRAVLASIPETERAKDVKNLDLDIEDLPLERALGVQWCVKEDAFTFQVTIKECPCSRCGILSMVSSIYDPLGLLAPLTFKAKCILQELCKLNIGWDEDLPETHAQAWKQWWQELPKVREFQVCRSFVPDNFGNVKTAQMHHFSDASDIGYGTVTYLRLTSSNKVHVTFLMGKARVAPLKVMTTPRMELTAAVLAVRMDRMLSEELHIDLDASLFWTDSMTVLRYIRNESRRYQTFVANRINIIRSASEVSQWRYIGTKLNPADDASRGLHVDNFLKRKTWINGPDFLKEPPHCWPDVPFEPVLPPNDPELRKGVVTVNVTVKENCDATTYLLNYFSTWIRLKKAVAWLLRLKSILLDRVRIFKKDKDQSKHVMITRKQKQDKTNPYVLSVSDLENAEMAILQFCQGQGFPQEISCLQKGMQNINSNSAIFRLDPFLDNGSLRVGGRLSKMAMPSEQKHPAILPKDHHVSKLVLLHIHHETGHGGRNVMLSRLRQRYWIPCANSLARKVIYKCTTCRRVSSSAGEQKMADLPVDRLTPDLPPFTHVGVDYFGPLEIKRNRSIVKRYGVIFTCLTSRAIHLEIAHSLDTDSCIHAFRRFIARRGRCPSCDQTMEQTLSQLKRN